MVSFEQITPAVIEKLKAKAAGIGVPKESILPGYEGEIGVPPFLYVFTLPEKSKVVEGRKIVSATAEVTILCGVAPAIDKTTSLVNAMELMGRVATVLNGDLQPCDPPFGIFSFSSDNTIVALYYTAPFKHLKPLLEAAP